MWGRTSCHVTWLERDQPVPLADKVAEEALLTEEETQQRLEPLDRVRDFTRSPSVSQGLSALSRQTASGRGHCSGTQTR